MPVLASTKALTFERIQLPPEWRCEVCDHNRVVFLYNAELLLCAPCASFLVSERTQAIGLLTQEDAIAWLARNPTGKHGDRSRLRGLRFFSEGMKNLTGADLRDLRRGEFAFLEILQDPAWRS